MRRASFLPLPALVIVTVLIGATAHGQQSFNQPGLAPEAGAPAANTAPPPVYLGLTPDETHVGRGIRVDSVSASGPAAAAGVMAHDVITAINGQATSSVTDLDNILKAASPGDKLQLTVDRGGRPQSLTVTLAARPAPAASGPPGIPPASSAAAINDPAADIAGTPRPSLVPPSDPSIPPLPAPGAPATRDPLAGGAIRSRPAGDASQPSTVPAPEIPEAGLGRSTEPLPAPGAAGGGGASLGISVLPLNEQARPAYGVPVRRGALIAGVRPGSPADRAGLPVGGVIVAIDGRPVDSDNDLVAAIRGARPGQEVELTYYQGDRRASKSVRLAPATGAAPSASPARTSPGPSGLGMSGQRPILDRAARAVESLTQPRPGPAINYDPSEVATLQGRVAELAEQLRGMEERLKALESRLPGAAPASSTFGGGLTPPGTNP